MIISVSRRCDIPRFSFDWFLEKLDAGYVDVRNPFNPRQTRRVSLLPPAAGRPAEECAELFAFWTRDPASILANTDDLEGRGYSFFVMTTFTSYPAVLEPNAPQPGELLKTMENLSLKITPARLIWRYDPVFLSDMTDVDFHRRNFARLAAALKGVVKKVIVSVYDEYPRAEKRLAELEQRGSLKRLAHYSSGVSGKKTLVPMIRRLLADMAEIAGREGLEIQSCAEENSSDPISGDCGIPSGACIDGEYILKNFGLTTQKDRGQTRPGCLCCRSVDIGSYGPCPAGCVYCYAHSISGGNFMINSVQA